jgi:hypothetical protein
MFKSARFCPLIAAMSICASAVPGAGQTTTPQTTTPQTTTPQTTTPQTTTPQATNPIASEFRAENAAPMRFDKAVRALQPRVATPAFAPLAPGLLARRIVEASSTDGDYSSDIWSLLVGPATETSEARLPGAAVLSLNAGKVDVVVGSEKRSLAAGMSTQVAEGASFKLVNTDKDRPALLRAIVLSAGR